MNRKNYLAPLALALLLTGCSGTLPETSGAGSAAVDASNPDTSSAAVDASAQKIKIGSTLEVAPAEKLKFLEHKDLLSADGLYYTAWTVGDSVPYNNSDGETIDLYDAQLYLLTSESSNDEKAETECAGWLSAARQNYEILTEENCEFNGQAYTLLTYNCTGDDNPYDRGISAFGFCGSTAVCAELTCLESCTEDARQLLTGFLNNCYFSID